MGWPLTELWGRLSASSPLVTGVSFVSYQNFVEGQSSDDLNSIVIIKTRNETNGRKPKALFKQTCLKHTNRQVYGAVVNSAAKQHYRPDLLQVIFSIAVKTKVKWVIDKVFVQDAVVRASAILRSQRAKSGAKKTGA
jgi:hypothetical protein